MCRGCGSMNRPLRVPLGFALGALALVLAVSAVGCAANRSVASPVAHPEQASNSQLLEELWKNRLHDEVGSDLTLGPGDLLEISVPMEQLRRREVRVSPEDTIELPYVGVMSVKGMTEEKLTRALQRRLSRYMYAPPVSLFVRQYGSREVAVVGAVSRPGLYTLRNRTDTLMDMINRAGGMMTDAAPKVILVPASANGSGLVPGSFAGIHQAADGEADGLDTNGPALGTTPDGFRGASVRRAGPVQGSMPEPLQPTHPTVASRPAPPVFLPPTAANIQAITISLVNPKLRRYLQMPARPYDTIIVPSAGAVTVGGWVQRPGAYPITRKMTALSAISAAGGPLFSSSGRILRTAADGERLSIPFSISEIQNGQQMDPNVQAGDVVMVNRSVIGAVPYTFYEIFNRFGTGVAIPVP